MTFTRRLLTAACVVLAVAASAEQADAGRYHPRLRFQVLRTPHFTLYYHQGGEERARRLASIAEDVRRDLARRTTLEPPAHVHVVLVDQSDVANGWSTPVPYDLIEIAAVPPSPSSTLGNQDDWLRTVFAHEFAHVLHLDRVGGVTKGLRWLLGRHPMTFPNLYVPEWQVEGFATWAEGAASGHGRNRAADVGAVVSEASGARGFPLDRAGGGLVAWPSGHTPYFFGGRVYQRIAGTASEAALGEVTRKTARRLPYFGSGAFRQVFGKRPRDIWRETFLPSTEGVEVAGAGIRRLSHDGFAITGPRIVRTPAGSSAGDAVYYSSQGPHRFPEIRRVAIAGGASAPVTSRYAGETLSSDGRWAFFDQLEYDASVALVSDLYVFDLESRRTHRLTRGARLTDPDVDGAGARLVAVRAGPEGKRLVTWPIERGSGGRPSIGTDGARVLGTQGCDYASPRWSPDASRIAATRQCPGSLPSIVVMESDGSNERPVSPRSGARDVTPAWSPDGRRILFASDRQDRRFKIFGASDASSAPSPEPEAVMLVDVPGGAMWPDVAPDGRTVVFTSVTADGHDVFAATLPDRSAGPASPALLASARGTPVEGDAEAGPRSRDPLSGSPVDPQAYSVWKTLAPRAWLPFGSISGERVDLGGSVGASDALGYHEYQSSVSWRISNDEVDFAFEGPAIEWRAYYSYNRWTPTFFLSAAETIDDVRIGTPAPSVFLTSDERTREFFAGVVIPARRVRVAQTWLAGVDFQVRRVPSAAAIPDRSRHALRAAWGLSSAHVFGYSISPERGVRTSVTIERVLPALGADGQATTVTADARGYIPAFGRHDVLAVRAAVGSSRGDRIVRRRFGLGEAALPLSGLSFSDDALGLLRGLGSDARVESAIAVANVDYRFPLLRVERGVRTWPVFLRDVHGSVFFDAGSAGPTLGDLPSAASAFGAEVSARFTFGYAWNVSLTAGVARVHDPSRVDRRDRTAAFVRTGYAF